MYIQMCHHQLHFVNEMTTINNKRHERRRLCYTTSATGNL